MKLWLDDIRPAPPGWVWAKSVAEAKHYLASGEVEEASFDHDLGDAVVAAEGKKEPKPYPEDGSTLVRWLAETGCWPKKKPTVHSANPVGAAYMRGMIDRYGPY